MKNLILCLTLTLASCGSVTTTFDKAAIPVTEIFNRTAEIINTLKSADLNSDGEIKGVAEWLALGTSATQLFIKWASESTTQE